MLGIILAALVGIVLAVILAVVLKWDKIVDWFKGRQPLKQSDKDNIAFTIQEKIADGKYKTVQGIFNKDSNKVLDGVQYESKKVDEKLAEAHRNDELVIYE